MPLTTTDSLNGKKPKLPQCGKCHERVPRLYGGEMGQMLCAKCAPPKSVIGGPIEE